MALFNIRWPGRAAQDDGKRSARSRRAVSTESVDALRRRARHRLIGAAVLLVAGVVGFPVLFDTQPRPIAVDIPISIPDKGQGPTVAMTAPVAPAPTVAAPSAPSAPPPATTAPAASIAKAPAPAPSTGRASTADSLDRGEEVVASAPARPDKPEKAEKPVTAPPAAPRVATKPPETHREAAAPARQTATAAAAPSREDESARARALLEGKTVSAPAAAAAPPADAGAGRFVVQVGAFGDAGKAQEARAKLTRSGLATYVQSVDTKDGKRIRVRIGPFANKAEADRAAAKVKGLDLPASILTL